MTKEQFLMHLIRSLILEYRLSLETVSKLFGCDKNDLYNRIVECNSKDIRNALIYILDYETKGDSLINQKKAMLSAIRFLHEFKKATTTKEKVDLINQLNDNPKIKEIKRKKRKEMTNEDINTIIKYRYKYCLSALDISGMFDIDRRNISYWEEKIDEDFRKKLDALNDYKFTLKNGSEISRYRYY